MKVQVDFKKNRRLSGRIFLPTIVNRVLWICTIMSCSLNYFLEIFMDTRNNCAWRLIVNIPFSMSESLAALSLNIKSGKNSACGGPNFFEMLLSFLNSISVFIFYFAYFIHELDIRRTFRLPVKKFARWRKNINQFRIALCENLRGPSLTGTNFSIETRSNLNMKNQIRSLKSRFLEAQTIFLVADFFKRKVSISSIEWPGKVTLAQRESKNLQGRSWLSPPQ